MIEEHIIIDANKSYKVSIDISDKLSSHMIMFNYVKPNSIILDIGCACGDLGVILKKEKNCKCYGLEYDKNAIQNALNTGC